MYGFLRETLVEDQQVWVLLCTWEYWEWFQGIQGIRVSQHLDAEYVGNADGEEERMTMSTHGAK